MTKLNSDHTRLTVITNEEFKTFFKGTYFGNHSSIDTSVISVDTQDPITIKELEDWIQALKSGKYIPGKKSLVVPNTNSSGEKTHSYCCLGVYASLNNMLLEDDSYYSFNPNNLLEKEFMFSHASQDVLKYNNKPYKLSGSLQALLARCNDINPESNFDLIIKFLEELVLPKVKLYWSA